MILYRFMSREELRRLKAGQTLINESKHKGFRTESRGFCFTPDEPAQAIHWLSGNIDTDVCVKMEVQDGAFRKTRAWYRDPEKDLPDGLPTNADDVAGMWRTEYCTTRYSLRQVDILDVSTEYANIPGIKETQALMRALGYRRNQT